MKFCGTIGYSETVETTPGVFSEIFEEMHYAGDVLRSERQYNASSDKLNDDLTVKNRISVIADTRLYKKAMLIRYVNWEGVRYKVTDILIEPPRLILTLGGVYNGHSPGPSDAA